MRELFLRGFLHTAVGKYSRFAITLLVAAILSRLLTPMDYGTVALVSVIAAFADVLVDAGLGPAVIQNKTLDADDNTAIFWFSAALSAVVALVFGACGWLLELFYGGAVYREVTWLLAGSVFTYGLSIVPRALLTKEKNFRDVNLILVAGSFAGGAVGVTTALLGVGVFALPLQSITSGLVSLGLYFARSPLRVRRLWSLGAVRKVWGFASWQWAFSLVNYFTRNLDSLLVGKLLGPTALGHYNKSYNLMMQPNQLLMGVILPVMHPILSDYQNDVATVRRAFLRIVRVLGLVGLPLSVFCALSSREIIFSLYGDQWGDAVFPFSVLAWSIWAQMTLSPAGAVYMARGRTRAFFLVGLGSGAFIIAMLCVGLAWGGIDQVAIALTIAFTAQWPVLYAVMAHLVLESTLREIVRQLCRPALVALISAMPLLALNWLLPDWNVFACLGIKLATWGLFYLAGAVLLREHRVILDLLRKPGPDRIAP
ncbi:MAG: lipopolysaccharide biosynthesis protein [Propionibacteriaceae bacterium]|jgi:O-antigen/teichoic acid export membrane protein|nr:lipopolysaccharide biosynthesis protein [Propionibacteriaceae bacterium]